MVTGFKGTDSNMTCKTFRYELGKTYQMNKENLVECAIGYHFSPKLEDVFSYYYDKDSRFFEVEADECLNYSETTDKVVCAQITLTKEIFPYDVNFPNHKELMMHMCKLTPYNLKWIPAATKTNEFIMELIKAVPIAVEYVTNPTYEMMMEAVKGFGPSILFFPQNVSEDIKMQAIKSHWYSIRHIKNPSESLQFEAVYNDIDAIHFIDNPTDAVKEYVKGVIDGTITPIPPGGINYDGIYLNEICGGKDSSEDDWVELVNTTSSKKDIGGLVLTKNDKDVYTIPKNTAISPKSVFTISSINNGMFSISNTKQVIISLSTPSGEVLDTFNKNEWFPGAETIENGHPIGGSYAKIPDGTGIWERQEVNSIGELNANIEVPPSELIRINEICGGLEHSDDDWIELINLSKVNVDISGYLLLKDDGSQQFVIPSGSIIEPNGLLCFNNIRDAMFKISNSKSVNIALETKSGIVIDYFDKDANLPVGSSHPIGGSYSRNPDGTGDWEISNMNTIGEYNSGGVVEPDTEDYTGLVINEVCVSPNGVGNDWVEILNTSNNTINISGCKTFIGSSNIKTFEDGTQIAPNERLVIDATFASIAYKNVTVKLLTPINNEIDKFDKDSVFEKWQYQGNSGSYARYPDGTGSWIITYTSSRNGANIENNINPQPFPTESNFSNIILNEICGGDAPEYVDGVEENYDWIEIYNNGDTEADLYGMLIYKDGAPMYIVPKGVKVAAKSYKIFGQKEGDFETGISNSKQVSISLVSPYGVDIDSFDKTADINSTASHIIGGSYARIPNIVGKWNSTDTATKGSANIGEEPLPPTGGMYDNLVLNEVCGGDLEPTLWDDGVTIDNDDWVEIYNKGTEAIDISNTKIIKDGSTVSYTFPDGSSLEGGQYIVLSRAKSQLTSGISNGSKLISMGIYTPTGDVIDELDCKTAFTTVGHALGGSYARIPNGTGEWTIMGIGQSSKGISNEAVNDSPYSGLVLNEICGYGTGDKLDKDDWIELYNNSDFTIDLSNIKILYSNSTEEVVDSLIYTFPSGTYISPKGYKVVTNLEGNISNVKVISLKLTDSEGAVIDMFDRASDSKESGHNPGGSYARIPNGTGSWVAVETHTQGVANPDSYTPPIIPPTGIDYSSIILNEICGGDIDGNDWIEIYNNSEKSINISGLIVKKDNTQIYKVPSDTIIGPHEYIVWGIAEGDFTNGISSSKAVKISLHSPDGADLENQTFQKMTNTNDVLYGNGHVDGGSYARIPNAIGAFVVREVNTKGKINE